MKILLILGHPSTESFNHAIADSAKEILIKNGHTVLYHDLYREGFDSIITQGELKKDARLDNTITSHCKDLSESDGIIIVHPNWWGQPPAILKGWIDRVIRPGVAYEFNEGDSGEGIPKGLLKAKQAIVFNTADTPDKREKDIFGDPLENIWKKCIFDFCGVKNFYRKTFSVIVTSTPKERDVWLKEVADTTNSHFPSHK